MHTCHTHAVHCHPTVHSLYDFTNQLFAMPMLMTSQCSNMVKKPGVKDDFWNIFIVYLLLFQTINVGASSTVDRRSKLHFHGKFQRWTFCSDWQITCMDVTNQFVTDHQPPTHRINPFDVLSFLATTLCLNKVPTFKLSLTLSNLNWFSKFVALLKAYAICYKTHTTIPTSP